METDANIALVAVNGDLDVTQVPSLRRSLDELVDDGCQRIILNMKKASYIDSAGMGLILSETRRMREHGALLSLTNVTSRVLRALTIARVVDLIPISKSCCPSTVSQLDPSVLPEWRTTLAVDCCHLDETRAHVRRLLCRMPFSSDEIFDLGLAIGEAMGNAVDHGCGTALVSVACYEDRAVVDVTDCGSGFELAEGEEPPESDTDDRGRGIALMRLLSDAVTIERRASGAGTHVQIVKLFPTNA